VRRVAAIHGGDPHAFLHTASACTADSPSCASASSPARCTRSARAGA